MGTYVDAAFGHSGDLESVFRIGMHLIEHEGFQPYKDAGYLEFSPAALRTAWDHPSMLHNHIVLESEQFLLWVYPKGGMLHHLEVKWWALAENGRMDSGLGRDAVRERSQAMAARFKSDRILYFPDSIGVNSLCEKAGIADEEEYLRKVWGPPWDWNQPASPEGLQRAWFRDAPPFSASFTK